MSHQTSAGLKSCLGGEAEVEDQSDSVVMGEEYEKELPPPEVKLCLQRKSLGRIQMSSVVGRGMNIVSIKMHFIGGVFTTLKWIMVRVRRI